MGEVRYFFDRVLLVPEAIGRVIVVAFEGLAERFAAFLDGGAQDDGEIIVTKWSERRDYLNYGPESYERYAEAVPPTEEEVRAAYPRRRTAE
ncbi:MAG: hypothetical protein M3R38_21480 [Actinomycetota bacterium]|nr:hypothetical protein [Actinomycetota bacterium]